MSNGTNISSPQELELWLKDKPRAWAVAMAARAAFRALPEIAEAVTRRRDTSLNISLTLAVFRATLISSVAAMGAAEDMKAAAAAAVRAAAAVADAVTRATYDAGAARAAYAAADAARAAYANTAIDAATRAAYTARAAHWRQVSKDAGSLTLRGSVDPVTALLQAPLWSQTDAPPWVRNGWAALRNNDVLRDAGFAPWFDWYESLLPLSGTKTVNRFDPALTRRIALQSKEWWDRGALAVNTDIAEWLAEQDARREVPQQVPAVFRFAEQDGRIGVAPQDVTATDLAAAQAFLDDLRERAAQASERLESARNAVPFLADEVTRLRNFLPPAASDLNPFLLRRRLITIDAAVTTLQTAGPSRELADDPMMQVTALAFAGRELMLCFPDLRTREREAIARAIPGQERRITEALGKVAEAAANAPEAVTEAAAAALDTTSTLAREAAEAPGDTQTELFVEPVMVLRNFLSGAAQFGRDLGSRVRPGILDGAKAVAKPTVIFSFAKLVGVLIDPIYIAPALLIGYGQIEPALKLVAEQVTTLAKELKKTAKKPKADE